MAKFSFILMDPLSSFGGLATLELVFHSLREFGYEGVECNLTASDLPLLEGLRELSERADLPLVSFLTGANYFGEGLCLSSPREDVRQRAVDRLRELTEVAARFGAVLVVGQMQGFRSDESDHEVAETRIEEGLRSVASAAEEHGSTVVVEPVNHLQCGFHNSLDEVLRLTGRIGSPQLRPMLDSFHMNIEELSMGEPIRRAGEDLAHFHLCESSGRRPGSGHLDFALLLRALEAVDYSGYVSVKVYREPWELTAKASIDYLRSLL